MEENINLYKQIKALYKGLFAFLMVFILLGMGLLTYLKKPELFSSDTSNDASGYVAIPEEDFDTIENGIHVRTGFIEADGLMETVNNCTNCHSSELVLQNRMSKDRWIGTIRWMQETQNLWDLGGNEEIIVNYLVINYPVIKKGRRMLLTSIEWYDLEN